MLLLLIGGRRERSTVQKGWLGDSSYIIISTHSYFIIDLITVYFQSNNIFMEIKYLKVLIHIYFLSLPNLEIDFCKLFSNEMFIYEEYYESR